MSCFFDPDEAPTNPWSRRAATLDQRRFIAQLLPEQTVVTPSPFDAPASRPSPDLTFLPGHDSAVGLSCVEDGVGPRPLSTPTSWSNRSAGSLVPQRSGGRCAVRPRRRRLELELDDVDVLDSWTLAGRLRGALLGLFCLASCAVALLFRRPSRSFNAAP